MLKTHVFLMLFLGGKKSKKSRLGAPKGPKDSPGSSHEIRLIGRAGNLGPPNIPIYRYLYIPVHLYTCILVYLFTYIPVLPVYLWTYIPITANW